MAIQARTVIATIKAHGLEQDTKAVRFAGESFADLKARMVAANLPGLNEESFFEVKIGEEFVCLLDSEVLPPGDIHVRVFTLPTGAYYALACPAAYTLPCAYDQLDTIRDVPEATSLT